MIIQETIMGTKITVGEPNGHITIQDGITLGNDPDKIKFHINTWENFKKTVDKMVNIYNDSQHS